MHTISYLKKYFNAFFTRNILFLFRNSRNKEIIIADLERWQKIIQLGRKESPKQRILIMLFQGWPEYRNLFYYRLANDPLKHHLIYFISQSFYPPMKDLKLHAHEGIGPGLFIQHGRSSGIMAQRIGDNCFINQHVSIGYNWINERPPIIGNNVSIRAGAKVYGAIHIGDNAVIGANAVITKDVPQNCTVVGIPAKIIRRNGKRVDENL